MKIICLKKIEFNYYLYLIDFLFSLKLKVMFLVCKIKVISNWF